jgi:hypothetical protein
MYVIAQKLIKKQGLRENGRNVFASFFIGVFDQW